MAYAARKTDNAAKKTETTGEKTDNAGEETETSGEETENAADKPEKSKDKTNNTAVVTVSDSNILNFNVTASNNTDASNNNEASKGNAAKEFDPTLEHHRIFRDAVRMLDPKGLEQILSDTQMEMWDEARDIN